MSLPTCYTLKTLKWYGILKSSKEIFYITRKLIQSLQIVVMKLMIKVRVLLVKYPACKNWVDISILEPVNANIRNISLR